LFQIFGDNPVVVTNTGKLFSKRNSLIPVAIMAFSLSKLTVATGLATGALLTCIGNANAESFGFKFDTTFSTNNSPKGSVWLESVKIGDEIIDDFSLVKSAKIIYNDEYTTGNSGAASSDMGDEVEGYSVEMIDGELVAKGGISKEDATAEDIVKSLGSQELNSIIDTEDSGTFTIDLQFGKIIDNLLIWERGKNSDLQIQAVDANGNLIGEELKITRKMWFDAGYSIDTKEIGGAQKVGSLGISIADDLGVDTGLVETIRFSSKSGFNGPDWKFVGTDGTRNLEPDPEKVPEPAFVLGLGIFGSILMLKKRNQAAA
jgi:hypothetical protein